ncbi:FadR family transcriptional regulator [Enterobacteriaceae bacterium H20N1]|uniref:FadR family transcriptional regulator n=1 Tax=Dryocola boscaweniae TaxID=2925397 RepID=A0A9X2WBF9_9ENTR|nr:FadR/GntR family transcriptional regulator [Dryocola boscaweniae]MCT4703678.1 FadR family transcriptional regulator [Dryocola boscaweniae]MCT4716856.1 FadR family transcriptional regulator [Dryocola boscaweniae]MCT4720846.1 FadR family transcriptional regulator [Dryocola boscaweniae]
MQISREKTENSSGYDRVVKFLREQLLSGELKAGDSLLPERDLSARLGVSRPVLREALRALAMIGAVEIRHGVGTVVTKPDVSILGEFFTFVLAHQPNVVDDVMQARIAIERQAIRLACRRATQSDYDRLAACLSDIVDTIHSPEAGGLADFRFHETIVNASGSPTLINIYQSISVLMHRSHLDRREQIIQVEGIEEFLIDHHRAIFSAIVERNEDKADELLGRHFEIGADFRRRATIRMVGATPYSN